MNQWSPKRATEWYVSQPWLVGCNFLPSTAINQLEMWQAETYDPVTIDRELGWAEGLGFNTSVSTCTISFGTMIRSGLQSGLMTSLGSPAATG